MKKYLFLIFMFLVINIIAIQSEPRIIEEKPNAYEVIKYMNNDLTSYPNDEYDFYLLFDKYKLDSKNFVSVLSFFNNYEYKILEVYPYINPMYQKLLNNIYKITYKGKNINDGNAYIYNLYLKELEGQHLTDEIEKALVNGVRIRMLKIHLTNDTLDLFLQKYSSVKYSLTNYGLFLEYDL